VDQAAEAAGEVALPSPEREAAKADSKMNAKPSFLRPPSRRRRDRPLCPQRCSRQTSQTYGRMDWILREAASTEES